MPITPEQKLKILQLQGLDAQMYDVTEDGSYAFPKANPQPAQPEAQPSSAPDLPIQPQSNKTSIGGALGSHALASTIPTAAALAVGSGIAAAPISAGLSIPLGLIGALAAGYGTSKLQEQVLPESFKNQLATAQQEHPIASTIGGFAPSALAFNPIKSAQMLPTVAKAVPKLFSRGGQALTTQEGQLLANTAINVGTGAGQDIYGQMQSDQPFNVPELLTTIGASSLLNVPTKAIGQGVFRFPGIAPHQIVENPAITGPRQEATTIPTQAEPPATFPARVLTPEQTSGPASGVPHGTKMVPVELGEPMRKYGYQVNREQPDVSTFEGEGGVASELAKQAQEKQDLITEMMQNRIEMERARAELARQREEFQKGVEGLRQSEESKIVTEKELFNRDLTPDERQAIVERQREQAQRRGVPVEYVPEITSKKPENLGKSVAGETTVEPGKTGLTYEERLARVSQTKGGLGTTAHEGTHQFMNDLRNSPNKADRELARRLDKIGSEEDVVKAIEDIKAKRDFDSLYGTKRQNFKNWWGDFKNRLKYNFGNEDPHIVMRRLMEAYEHNAPFGTRADLFPHLLPGKGGPTTVQPGPEEPKVEPRDTSEASKSSGPLQSEESKIQPSESGRNKDEGVPDKENIESNTGLLGKWNPKYSKYGGGPNEELPKIFTEENLKTGQAIESKLGEASFQAAKEAEKAQQEGFKEAAEVGKAEVALINPLVKELENAGYTDQEARSLLYKALVNEEPKYVSALETHFGAERVQELQSQVRVTQENIKQERVNSERTINEKSTKANKKAEEVEAFTRPDVERQSEESKIALPDVEDYTKDQPRAYGHWISPTGEMLRVSGGHDEVGKQILKHLETKGEAPKDNIGIYDALLNAGWARGVHEHDKKYLVDTLKPLTNAQRSALKNYGIERDASVSTYNNFARTNPDKVYSRAERIYERPTNLYGMYSEESKIKPEDSNFTIFPWSAQNDKVRKIDSKLGDALDLAWQEKDLKNAKWVNVPRKDIADTGASKEERDAALAYARWKFRGEGIEPTLSPRAKAVLDIYQPLGKSQAEEFKAAGIKVRMASGELRERGVSEFYAPDMLTDDAKLILTEKAGSKEAEKIQTDWAKYVSDKSDIPYDKALANIKEYSQALSRRNIHDIEFGPVREAQGYGVPESIREKDLLKVLTQYGRRAANDFSYWKYLQSDPYVASRLALSKLEGGKTRTEGAEGIIQHPDVINALRFFTGDFISKTTPKANAAIRAVVSGLLQTGTQIRNTVQTPALLSPYVSTTKDIKAVFSALGNLKDAYRKSLEYGARSGTMDFDRWHTLDSPDKFSTSMNRISELMRKYTGRDSLENFDRAYTFEVGKRIARGKVEDALAGDAAAKKWLDNFKLGAGNVEKPAEMNLDIIAKNFVDRVQGTYDARGLPIGAFDSQFAPFFALSRWGIEKSNVIWKDVLIPALKGENYLPLLTYTLGSLMTGTAIRELNQLMSGKKDYTPSVGEAYDQDRKDYMLAAFINLMQQGSFGGIVSDVARAASDTFIQHEYPKGPVSFPAADFLTVTLGQNLSDYTTALESGADPLETSFNLISNIAKSSLQNYRLAYSRILDQQGTERSNKFRDIRTFKKLQGEDVPALASFRGNQLVNKDIQKFKRTEDIGEAVDLLPKLISQAIEKSSGDPYKLKRELDKIKQNNYQTMPNFKTAPLEFVRYMSFLAKTQGEEEASARLSDYLLQNVKDRAKAQMVP